jgi:hypothetical protein
VCQQSVGLLQRIFDGHGLPTVSVTLVPEITQLGKPSLACFVAQPFGLTLGDVGDTATHLAILRACLAEASRDHPAGVIVDIGFRWTKDDLRERQLAKQAL